MTLLGGLSVVLQAIGLIVSAVGLRTTWREFHDPGERFRDPFVRALKRLDPRGHRDRAVHAGVAEAMGMIDNATGKVTYGTLPPDERAAIEMLADRVQGLRGSLETTAADIRKGLAGVASRVDGLEGHVATEVERLDRADRHVATDGLRLESAGLVIIAMGTLAQLMDALM